MKTGRNMAFARLFMVIALASAFAGEMRAQVFTTLHSFYGPDGATPLSSLLVTNNLIYGTTVAGGSQGNGVVFSMKTNGADYQILHSFTGGVDGSQPRAGLFLSGNTLYGTASFGGSTQNGVVFSLGTDGTRFTVLHTFSRLIWPFPTFPTSFGTNTDGIHPFGPLILWSNTLYGTAVWGGSASLGTLFALNPDGSAFRTLHSFVNATDSEGPNGALIPFEGRLYGTAEGLGLDFSGAVFSISPDGTGFTVLHRLPGNDIRIFGLGMVSNILYGVTDSMPGDRPPTGSIFKLGLDGGFTELHTFSLPPSSLTNYEGNLPGVGSLAFESNTLYGVNTDAGIYTNGTVFSIKPDGTAFTVLYSFTGGDDGGIPWATVTLSGNTLYGTTTRAGKGWSGTIFNVTLIPIPLPVITSQPSSKTNIAGTTATFSVAATGQVPLSYQWLKSTNLLPQQISATLILTNVSDKDAGAYSVIVTNGGGIVVSATAHLIVLDPTVISTQPLSRTNIAGSTANFRVTATGTTPLSYQWFKGPSAIPRQVGTALTLTNVSDADAASYSVVVSNSLGKATSAAATLVVLDRPRIIQQPLNQTNIAGTTASFSVTAIGTAPLTYQWLRGNIPLPQQRSPSMTLLKVSDADAASYSVLITNIAGSVTSTLAQLTIIDLPQLSAKRAGANALVFWPTGLTGFTLQWTTNLASAAWQTNSGAPVILNGQNTISIPFSPAQKFFRLGD